MEGLAIADDMGCIPFVLLIIKGYFNNGMSKVKLL